MEVFAQFSNPEKFRLITTTGFGTWGFALHGIMPTYCAAGAWTAWSEFPRYLPWGFFLVNSSFEPGQKQERVEPGLRRL